MRNIKLTTGGHCCAVYVYIWQSDEHNLWTSEKVLLGAYRGLVVTEPLTQGRSIKLHCQYILLNLCLLVSQYLWVSHVRPLYKGEYCVSIIMKLYMA